MKLRTIARAAAGAAVLLLAAQAHASPWTSLGRLNALTGTPQVPACQQRIINHYWGNAPVFTPVAVQSSGVGGYIFTFTPDLQQLSLLASNSPSLSKLPAALTYYSSVTTPKSISVQVQTGSFVNLSIEVFYANSSNLIQGSGWGIDRTELQYYELQESCPV